MSKALSRSRETSPIKEIKGKKGLKIKEKDTEILTLNALNIKSTAFEIVRNELIMNEVFNYLNGEDRINLRLCTSLFNSFYVKRMNKVEIGSIKKIETFIAKYADAKLIKCIKIDLCNCEFFEEYKEIYKKIEDNKDEEYCKIHKSSDFDTEKKCFSNNKINKTTFSNINNLSPLQFRFFSQIKNKLDKFISTISLMTVPQKISIQNLNLVDVSPLSNLRQLTELNLSNNRILDISPLKYLAELKDLDLAFNKIADISPLARLKKLEKLSLKSNGNISDLSALGNLTGLKVLDLSCNFTLRNITPLSNLVNLEMLNLEQDQITDISPLANLHKLDALYMSYNDFLSFTYNLQRDN